MDSVSHHILNIGAYDPLKIVHTHIRLISIVSNFQKPLSAHLLLHTLLNIWTTFINHWHFPHLHLLLRIRHGFQNQIAPKNFRQSVDRVLIWSQYYLKLALNLVFRRIHLLINFCFNFRYRGDFETGEKRVVHFVDPDKLDHRMDLRLQKFHVVCRGQPLLFFIFKSFHLDLELWVLQLIWHHFLLVLLVFRKSLLVYSFVYRAFGFMQSLVVLKQDDFLKQISISLFGIRNFLIVIVEYIPVFIYLHIKLVFLKVFVNLFHLFLQILVFWVLLKLTFDEFFLI